MECTTARLDGRFFGEEESFPGFGMPTTFSFLQIDGIYVICIVT